MSWYFCASANPKHYSNNTEQSLRVITEILVPAIAKPRSSQIMDIFCGQITDDVTFSLQQHNILLVLVPNNMTHILLPLDLTVKKHCKKILKKLFLEWYSKQIDNKLSLEKKDWGNQNSVWYYDSYTFARKMVGWILQPNHFRSRLQNNQKWFESIWNIWHYWNGWFCSTFPWSNPLYFAPSWISIAVIYFIYIYIYT